MCLIHIRKWRKKHLARGGETAGTKESIVQRLVKHSYE